MADDLRSMFDDYADRPLRRHRQPSATELRRRGRRWLWWHRSGVAVLSIALVGGSVLGGYQVVTGPGTTSVGPAGGGATPTATSTTTTSLPAPAEVDVPDAITKHHSCLQYLCFQPHSFGETDQWIVERMQHQNRRGLHRLAEIERSRRICDRRRPA